ncbi:MAG: sigma-70 family RNA polymerase sigma factor [Chitinivibrionales bacterium]|nr:sigma-70 family RNA polymerase sigma factor [Chitinivibrionales bacterium]
MTTRPGICAGPPHETAATDEELMDRVRDALDKHATRELVKRYSSVGLTVALQFLAERTAAEDALQESFLRLVRHRRKYRPGAPFSSWFYAIVRNVSRDMLRRAHTRARAAETLLDEYRSAQLRDSQENPFALLDCLDELDRRILTLRFSHGLMIGDIAIVLRKSPEAVKKRAQRALRRLREMMR